jgi:hypothetical protein
LQQQQQLRPTTSPHLHEGPQADSASIMYKPPQPPKAPKAPAKGAASLWDGLSEDLQEAIHGSATRLFFRERVLAELDAAVMVRGVSTALATPFQGQHLHGSGSSPQRATAIVCRDENQVLLRLSHDGECVYLKYLLARDPYCHAPLPDVVLDFCQGGPARIAKWVDTYCNRGHSYLYGAMLPILCELIFRLRSFWGLAQVRAGLGAGRGWHRRGGGRATDRRPAPREDAAAARAAVAPPCQAPEGGGGGCA